MNQQEDYLQSAIREIQTAVAEINMIYASQSKRIEKLEHEIFGNGRVGLAVQVRAILWIASGSFVLISLILAQTAGEAIGRLL